MHLSPTMTSPLFFVHIQDIDGTFAITWVHKRSRSNFVASATSTISSTSIRSSSSNSITWWPYIKRSTSTCSATSGSIVTRWPWSRSRSRSSDTIASGRCVDQPWSTPMIGKNPIVLVSYHSRSSRSYSRHPIHCPPLVCVRLCVCVCVSVLRVGSLSPHPLPPHLVS